MDILQLSTVTPDTAEARLEPQCVPGFSRTFHSWQGVTGQHYLHRVYTLIGCPAVPPSNYLLVARLPDGTKRVLYVGCAGNDAPSLNLAEIRHRGATLGAAEVHVHSTVGSEAERIAIQEDLQVSLGDAPTAAAKTA